MEIINGGVAALGALGVLVMMYYLLRKIVLDGLTHIVPPRSVMLVENDGVLRTLHSGRYMLNWNDKIHRCYLKLSPDMFPATIARDSFPLDGITIQTHRFTFVREEQKMGGYVDFTFAIDGEHPEIFVFKDAQGEPVKILIGRIQKLVAATAAPSSLVPGCDQLRALETEFGVHISYFYTNLCDITREQVAE